MNPSPFFYGLSTRWFGGDRLYRIYVSNRTLEGAYVAGQMYNERVAALQLQQFYFFLRYFVRRGIQRREERESHYDTIDVFSTDLLALDSRNFQIRRTDVVRTSINRRRSLWTPYNSGTVKIELADGTSKSFLLVGDHDADEIHKLLLRFDSDTEVTGKATPIPQQKPLTPRQRRFLKLGLTIHVFAFGLFFAVAAAVTVNLAESFVYAAVAVMNIGVCIWVLADRKKSKPETDSSVDGQ